MTATVVDAAGDRAKIGSDRTIRYTPAVTIVAAWISADTGVGPSMASGSQVCSGSCADLPAAPARNSSAMTVALPVAKAAEPAAANTTLKSSEWKWLHSSTIPTRKAASPTRVTMNAFFAAAAAAGRSYQWPISRYEQRPTPSHPT